MSKNDDALRCAEAIDSTHWPEREVAAHIRRLVAENEALQKQLQETALQAVTAFDQAQEAYERAEAQAALLRQITLTAHSGGLASMSEADALIAIRKLTLAKWSEVSHLNESAIRQHLEGAPQPSTTQQQWSAYAASRNRSN